jgi:hypothetical protein
MTARLSNTSVPIFLAVFAFVQALHVLPDRAATHSPVFCAFIPRFVHFVAVRWREKGRKPKVTSSQADSIRR